MTRVCVSARKGAVCVLLEMQHVSQCEYKRGECFGLKEGEFGSMTSVCVSVRKEAVWVLLRTLYVSQCEDKRHQSVVSHLEAKFCCS